MSNENKKTALPKLRFPEFQNAGEWKIEPFKDIYSFKGTNSLSREKLNYEEGAVKNIHYGDIHTRFSTLFDITKENVPFVNPSVAIDKVKEENYCIEGDLIFADASEDLNDIGKSIEIVNLNGEKVLSGLHTQFARQKEQKLVVGFAGHLFMSSAIRSQIQNESQGTKVLGISAGRLSKIDVCYPDNKREQQKIADTLSSLDDLLTAQSAKLDALKAHRRGLMQGLFPAEGETVPKLRFAEFREAEEWEVKKLGDVATFLNGRAYQQSELLESGKYKVLRLGNLFSNNHWYYSDLELDENKYCSSGDLLYAWSASFGPRMWTGEKVIYHYHIWKVIEKKGVVKPFLFLLLDNETNRIKEAQANGLGMLHITKGSIEAWKCLIPKDEEEQQKIAACLSSLENSITAQGQRVDALKLHKRGLMQGLFPSFYNPEA